MNEQIVIAASRFWMRYGSLPTSALFLALVIWQGVTLVQAWRQRRGAALSPS